MRNQNGVPSIDAARKREAQRANASTRRFVVRGLLPALNVFLALSYGSEGRADISAAWGLLAMVHVAVVLYLDWRDQSRQRGPVHLDQDATPKREPYMRLALDDGGELVESLETMIWADDEKPKRETAH
jgi:hypothetical protein